MPFLDSTREYRSFTALQPLKTDTEERNSGYIVEGYASTVNEPYVLFEDGGIQYKEVILPGAFNSADLRDVIFQFDHAGMVYARSKNGSLKLLPDEHGLKVRADLSLTSKARSIYEDISAGLIDQMSFSFIVGEGNDEYDYDTHTRIIHGFRKIYDVSAVSIPANPNTEIGIATRSAFNGFIEAEKQELLKREEEYRKRRRIELRLKLNDMR